MFDEIEQLQTQPERCFLVIISREKYIIFWTLTCILATVRNIHALSITSTKLPMMEWAFDTVLNDHSAHTEIRAQVRAVSIENEDFLGFLTSKYSKCVSQATHTYGFSRRNIVRFSHTEPSIGKWWWQFNSHPSHPSVTVDNVTFSMIRGLIVSQVLVSDVY